MSYVPGTENPQVPSAFVELFKPDQLIAGRFPIITAQGAIVGGGGAYQRGTVMGIVTATGVYIPSVATATDGSQAPKAILGDYTDATAGNVAGAIYLTGEYNINALTFDASFTAASLAPLLRPLSIFLRSAVSAAPVASNN